MLANRLSKLKQRGISPSPQMQGQLMGSANPVSNTQSILPNTGGISGPISPSGPTNLPPNGMNRGFDPRAFGKLLSPDQLKDFTSLGKNIGGDYSAFARNAGGGSIEDVLRKRYGKLGGGISGPVSPGVMKPRKGIGPSFI